MLTNAIYFKGDWVSPFNKRGTQDQNFSVSAQRKVNTPLMQQKASFGYGEEETLQAWRCPMRGGICRWSCSCPRGSTACRSGKGESPSKGSNMLLAKLRNREVIAYIPKFKLETAFGLKTTLEALGMKQAFSRQADFSGISTEENLYISAVIHKAYVDVNEEGTEAAAATGVVMKAMLARRPVPTPVFRADHPFFFLIRDTRSGSILFLGRVIDPTK